MRLYQKLATGKINKNDSMYSIGVLVQRPRCTLSRRRTSKILLGYTSLVLQEIFYLAVLFLALGFLALGFLGGASL